MTGVRGITYVRKKFNIHATLRVAYHHRRRQYRRDGHWRRRKDFIPIKAHHSMLQLLVSQHGLECLLGGTPWGNKPGCMCWPMGGGTIINGGGP